MSWIRLGIVLAGIALILPLFHLAGELPGWIGVVVVTGLFMIVADRHGRVEHGIRRGRAWIDIRRRHIARLEHQWDSITHVEIDPVDSTHPFERDLNITGERSLLHLIDTSVSTGGHRRLKAWLLDTRPEMTAIEERRQLVGELVDLSAARDRIALSAVLSGMSRQGKWNGERLLGWLDSTGDRRLKGALLVLAGLAGMNLTAMVFGALGLVEPIWPATLVLYAAFYLHKRKDFSRLFQEALYLDGVLGGAAAVLRTLERFPVGGRPLLRELMRPFNDPERRPSFYLQSITRIANAASMQKNGLLRLLLNLLVPWDYYFAWRLELAREGIRALLPVWLDRLYQLEALSSLANHIWLDPRATFPVITWEGNAGHLLEGIEMHHPLIPETESVPNDFTIDADGNVVIVTGSNMSGKSTFLRTIGTHLVLAYAGGGVPASRLVIAPFRLFTCINVSDSVNDGISYFYAEVRRLRQLLDEVRVGDPIRVFYLIDEIFRGTNNRERLIGARSYIRALAVERGVGAISTHDLELVRIADEISRVRNYHFRETIVDGAMHFDYRIRTGPSPTTNALIIMKAEGLPVDPEVDFDGNTTQEEHQS